MMYFLLLSRVMFYWVESMNGRQPQEDPIYYFAGVTLIDSCADIRHLVSVWVDNKVHELSIGYDVSAGANRSHQSRKSQI
jgi:hypothetical protein